jgi:transposase-like protein
MRRRSRIACCNSAWVSRRFQQWAEKALREFKNRSLENDNFLALWTRGKHVAGEQVTRCMGVTETGYKKVLDFTQATTETARPIKEMLRGLIERGLTFDKGIFCVADGAKGLRKALDEVFGQCAQVQRCQWLGARECSELSSKDGLIEAAKEASAGV